MTNDRVIAFIGLNPSTADEKLDDPTIRRCIAFGKLWGFGSLCMLNIFAFRATLPAVMRAQESPIGPENDRWIFWMIRSAHEVVAAWGTHGQYLNRGKRVQNMLCTSNRGARCLGRNLDGTPKHPLYMPKDSKLVAFT